MSSATPLYACYRRVDPATGHLHRSVREDGQPTSVLGEIERTVDPALFFHAEKYRESDEATRVALMGAPSFAIAEALMAERALNDVQRHRWQQVRNSVLRCAVWFAMTQHAAAPVVLSPARFDGLDVSETMALVRERLTKATRLWITGSRSMSTHAAGYALIDWYVHNRELAASGHGVPGPVDEIISSNENGAESIGEEWAMRNYVPVAHVPVDAEGRAKDVRLARQDEIAQLSTHLLVFQMGPSKDGAKTIDAFVRLKKPYWRFSDMDVSRMKQQLGERGA